MHGGVLAKEDIERIGINIRDWIRQTGQENSEFTTTFARAFKRTSGRFEAILAPEPCRFLGLDRVSHI
jgi:hypothetical protein